MRPAGFGKLSAPADPDAAPSLGPRPGWMFGVAVAVSFLGPLAAVATAWTTGYVGVSGWRVAGTAVAVSCVALAVGNVVLVRAVPRWAGPVTKVASLVALGLGVSSVWWILPVKMAVADHKASATADRYLATTTGCQRPTIRSIGPLRDVAEVCSLPNANPAWAMVSFSRPGTVDGVEVHYGLVYAPHAHSPADEDDCVRHLYGHWWQTQTPTPDCPTGWRFIPGG